MSEGFERILEFCAALYDRRVPYVIRLGRPDTLMVCVAVPGQRWEIEFFENGTVEVERFVSTGVEEISSALEEVLQYFAE
jgi:hypothetical protein